MAQDSSRPDFWNIRYQQGVTPWEGAQPDPLMTTFAKNLPAGARVLLPGCGSASDVAWMLQAGMQVDAIDFSEEAILRAAQALHDQPVRLWQADFFSLPEQQDYDLVFERAFLCALPPRLWESYTQKMQGLIRTGGYLAGLFFVAETPKGPPFGTSRQQLETLLGESFSLQECQLQDSAVPVFAQNEYWMVWRRC